MITDIQPPRRLGVPMFSREGAILLVGLSGFDDYSRLNSAADQREASA